MRIEIMTCPPDGERYAPDAWIGAIGQSTRFVVADRVFPAVLVAAEVSADGREARLTVDVEVTPDVGLLVP